MTEKQIIERLRQIECDLSPENLTHDGELDAATVRIRGNRLQEEQSKLISKLGRKPTMAELYPSCR